MDPSEPTSTIDDLLVRYLVLLDEYTTLRADLSRLQAATFQHLARANFAAERGTRYGADQYDERMQASRTVVGGGGGGDHAMRGAGVSADTDEKKEMMDVDSSGSTSVEFRVVTKSGRNHGGDDEKEQKNKKKQQQQEEEKQNPAQEAEAEGEAREGTGAEVDEGKRAKSSTVDTTENPQDFNTHSNRQQVKENKTISPPGPVDPLRWFGVLTPLSLRETQACQVEVVERIVPRLVTVDAAMREVEIQVRRAKKMRAKREKANAIAAAAAAANSVPAPVAVTKDIEATQQDAPVVVQSAEAAAA